MTYVVAGTGVTYAVGRVFYSKLLSELHAELLVIPGLGLRHNIWKAGTILVNQLTERGHNADNPAVLVGHSQGGLVALAAQAADPYTVDRVVTLAAPLAGSQWASKLVPIKSVRDMVPNSELLRFLNSYADTESSLNIQMTNDLLCMPSQAMNCSGGHLKACWSDDIIELVNYWIGD